MSKFVSKREKVLVLISIVFFIQLGKLVEYKNISYFFNIILWIFSFFNVLPWMFLMFIFWDTPLTRFHLYFPNYFLLVLWCLISLFYRGNDIFIYPILYIVGFLLFLFAYKIKNLKNIRK